MKNKWLFITSVIGIIALLLVTLPLLLRHSSRISDPSIVAAAPDTTKAAKSTTIDAAVPSPGFVTYAKTTTEEPKGPVDVVEFNLKTGSSKVLISHNELTDAYVTVYQLQTSPDGKYTAMEMRMEFDPADLKNNSSLKALVAKFGLTGQGGKGIWLLEREVGRFIKVNNTTDTMYTKSWSPSGRYLLLGSAGNSDNVYDTKSAKLIKLPVPKADAVFGWTPKDDNLVVVKKTGSRRSSIYLYSVTTGKNRFAFKWSHDIENLDQAPNGKGYALFDGKKVYLVNSHGGGIRRVPIKIEDDSWIELAYNGDGSRLAVLSSYSYGEPHVNTTEELWCVNPVTAKATKVSEWMESLLQIQPDSGSTSSRELIGWMPNNKRVLLKGRVTFGGESGIDSRSDWLYLSTCDVTRSMKTGGDVIDPGERNLFDVKEGSQAINWWM